MDKAEILKTVNAKLSEKVEYLQKLIAETRAANNETKSSMGDKYETSREMVQQEINNLQIQLNDVLKQLDALRTLSGKVSQKVEKGSLVQTSNGLFYIAVSAGEIMQHGKKIYAISPESPLAQAIKGLKQKEKFVLNGKADLIENIW